MSPIHWVTKDVEETRFCIVTYLRKLNEGVEVEASTFPTPSEVIMEMDPTGKHFMVSNLASRYYQLIIPDYCIVGGRTIKEVITKFKEFLKHW